MADEDLATLQPTQPAVGAPVMGETGETTHGEDGHLPSVASGGEVSRCSCLRRSEVEEIGDSRAAKASEPPSSWV